MEIQELSKIGCVQVLYKPNIETLNNTLSTLIHELNIIVIVDNSPDRLTKVELTILNNPNIIYVFNGKNLGIAKAQNIGIEILINKGIEYIYFTDQDSVPSPGTIRNLFSELCWLTVNGYKVGAIGPMLINKESNNEYKAKVLKEQFINSTIVEVKDLISSGSLIPSDILNKVGFMDETLFIDGVDHEWCWRSLKYGYRLFKSKKAIIQHLVGEGDRKFFEIPISISSPFRTFYQYRNYLILCKRNYAPTYWKISTGIKYLFKIFYYPIFIKPRIQYLKNILYGIISGINHK